MLRIFYVSLGTILLFASVLKLSELSTGTTQSTFLAAAFSLGIIGLEFALGLMNILRKPDKLTWFANLGLFTAFVIYLVPKVLQGAADCGCMGKLSVSPSNILAFDVGVLCTLFLAAREEVADKAELRLVGLLPVLTMLAAFAFAPSVIEKLNAQLVSPLTVVNLDESQVVEIDPINGFEHQLVVRLHNVSYAPLLVAGCTVDWCVVQASLPGGIEMLQPGEERDVTLTLSREPACDSYQRQEMIADVRKGTSITKVPSVLKVDFHVLPSDRPKIVNIQIHARAAAEYLSISNGSVGQLAAAQNE